MKIRINDRPDIQEIEVIINCVADDPLVNKIISALNTVDAKLLCRRQGETFQLGLADILYIESVDRKTFLYTEEQVYETDRRLYERRGADRRPAFCAVRAAQAGKKRDEGDKPA